MKDLDKQRDLLAKIDEALGKQKTTASVEVVAVNISGMIEKLKLGLKSILNWLSNLTKSVKTFSKLASLRY